LDPASLLLPATSGLPGLIRQNLPPWAAQLKNKKKSVIFGLIWFNLLKLFQPRHSIPGTFIFLS
jgi:hypothetical protein